MGIWRFSHDFCKRGDVVKGITKVAAVFAMIALVAVGLAAAVYPADAADTPTNTATSTDTLSGNSETPTNSCGISGTCKASCGCGCGGNPSNCGCGR